MKIKTTLVIPDSHADPRFSNERYEALGNFIVDKRPDHVVLLGDWGNLDSISFHNGDRPLLKEGMRLKDDLDSMQEAFELMQGRIDNYNKQLSVWKKKRYEPLLHWIEGNHEDRVRRYIESHPELQLFIISDNGLVNARGWNFVGYTDSVWIQGTRFTHVPLNPGNGRPISGKYSTFRAVDFTDGSVVFGHQHCRTLTSVRRDSSNDGRVVNAYCAGCYFDYVPEYVRGVASTLPWWRGITILHHNLEEEGQWDIDTFAMDAILNQYL